MDIFQRGQSMDFVQKSKFYLWVFFTEIMSEKMVFNYSGQKTNIVRTKNEVQTRAKKQTFLKRVSPWILSKNRTFSYRRFSHKSYQKRSVLILQKEKNDFKQKKIEVLKNGKKLTFSKGVSPRIWSKNRTFSYRFFSEKLCQKRSFLDILNSKQSF